MAGLSTRYRPTQWEGNLTGWLYSTPAHRLVDEALRMAGGTTGTTIPARDPSTLLAPAVSNGYDFDDKGGSVVTITVNAATCGQPDTMVFLFGPKDANGNFWGWRWPPAMRPAFCRAP